MTEMYLMLGKFTFWWLLVGVVVLVACNVAIVVYQALNPKQVTIPWGLRQLVGTVTVTPVWPFILWVTYEEFRDCRYD